MRRGDLYRVYKGTKSDKKNYRVFVLVSRQVLIDSKFSTVICAPVYTAFQGLTTQIEVDFDDGLKYHSSIHCDELVSIPKSMLTDFIGTLTEKKIQQLNSALKTSLALVLRPVNFYTFCI